MKIIIRATCSLALLATSLLSGQQTQTFSNTTPSSQVVTTTYVDPNNPPQGNIPGAPAVVAQPGYQSTNAAVNQVITPAQASAFSSDSTYGQSSVQYANPIVPVKPYVPYSQLTPASTAYPLFPYTTPEANQVNQQFMQRYSQQDQDFIRSQFGYPQTFKDPNAGLPPLGRPMRFNQPVNTAKLKAKGSGKKAAQNLKPTPVNRMADVPTYLFPGMVGLSKRLWVGSDYLFYLQNNIGVVIELIADKQVKSDEGKVLVVESKLKADAEAIFRKVGINPQSYSIDNAAPLPFFHILIMMYHADSKIFASVSGRLFEEAMPARLNLDSPVGTFQAITWERNEILITSAPQFPEQLELLVKNICDSFIYRYEYFAEEEMDEFSPDVLRPDSYEEEPDDTPRNIPSYKIQRYDPNC